MENCVLSVAFRDCVLCIKNSQLSRVFKRVFHKTQKEQNTPKGLKDGKYLIINNIIYNIIQYNKTINMKPVLMSKVTGVSVANFYFLLQCKEIKL